MTTEPALLFELREHVGTITFNRPHDLNTVNLDMARAMAALASKLPATLGMKAVVMRGAAKHFMAGGDIHAFHGEKRNVLPAISEIIDHFHAFVMCLQELPQPVVSCVRGVAAGGGFSLAIGADIIIADETAKFTPAYRKLGISPDGGGSFFLPRLVGTRKAMEMFLSGKTYGAQEARDMGLINAVAPNSDLDGKTREILDELVSNSSMASAATKQLLKGSELEELRRHLDAEKASFLSLAGGTDFTEGVDAFLQKRNPAFRN